MPLFDVLCPEHGRQEAFAHDPASLGCPLCSQKVERVWSNPATFRMDFREGWDPGFGKNIATKRERDNLLSEKNWRRIRD